MLKRNVPLWVKRFDGLTEEKSLTSEPALFNYRPFMQSLDDCNYNVK